jgi:hypothetical protein
MKNCSECGIPKKECEFYDGGRATKCKSCVRVYMDATKEHRLKQQAEFRSRPISKTRRSWLGMIQRCTHQQNTAFEYYGARGIAVCARWLSSFDAFLEDMGLRPFGLTIDRVDNDGNYSCGKCEQCISHGWKKNCQWTNRSEQQRHTRQNRLLSHNGETMCLTSWAEKLGVSRYTLKERLRRGWSDEETITGCRTKKIRA